MTAAMVSPLVSCEWLKEQIEKKTPDLRILDGTWNQPAWKRDAEQEYLDKHIEYAVRFNISDISDKQSSAPLMLPPPQQFEEQVGKIGISNDTHIVVYDNHPKFGFYSAGRVWWMFKTYGHRKISILDGGLPKWMEKGYPTVSGPQQEVPACSYKATYHPELYRTLEQMIENHSSRKEQIVDTRPKGRYDGTAPEPNPKIRSGHMYGSVSFPFTNIIDPQTKTMKDADAIKQAFQLGGVDLSKPIVFTCGGAMVAPLVAFASSLLGLSVPVYDGSWAQWVKNAPEDTMHLGVKGEDLN